MELMLLCIALFGFFFGSVIVMQALEFGFRVGDKTLAATGRLVKLSFEVAFKSTCIAGRNIIKRVMKIKPQAYTVKPIFAVTPLELQQMRNNNIFQSGKRQPVQIEYPSQQSK